jgi:hypothetical protein
MFTTEQAQWLWDKTKDTTVLNQIAVRDWLFELLTEQGFDVRDDIVTKLA